MPFIGNQPALSYTSFAKQDFTTSATTSYTLDHPVTNENEIALFINFVRQEPTTAYSASGTSLTLTSATSASDDMYCVFLGKAVQTVNPPNSSVGTSQLDSSLDFSSKTITLASNMKNTPAFFAYSNGLNTISPSSATKATFNTEFFDSDSVYDTSTNKFTVPSGGAGKYVITAQAEGQSIAGTSNMNNFETYIYKNGSKIVEGSHSHQNNNGYRIRNTVVSILDLAVADYIEVYVYGETASGNIYVVGTVDAKTNFSAYRLIGA